MKILHGKSFFLKEVCKLCILIKSSTFSGNRRQETFVQTSKSAPFFSSPPLHSLTLWLPPSFLSLPLIYFSFYLSLTLLFHISPSFPAACVRRKIPIENFPSSQYRNLLLPRLNFMFNNRYQGIEKGYIFLLETRLDSCYYQSVLPITNRLLILLVRNQSTVSIGFALSDSKCNEIINLFKFQSPH